MKKYILYVSVGLNLCLTIVCLCRTFPSQNLNFDYLGVIVGILSFLITLLLAWNIYSMVDFNRHRLDVVRLSKEINDGLHRNMAVTEGSLWMVYHQLLLNNDPLGLEYRLIYHAVCTMFHASHFDDIKTCDSVVKGILECVIKPETVRVTASSKRDLLMLLSSTKEPQRIDGFYSVLELVSKLRVVDKVSYDE